MNIQWFKRKCDPGQTVILIYWKSLETSKSQCIADHVHCQVQLCLRGVKLTCDLYEPGYYAKSFSKCKK